MRRHFSGVGCGARGRGETSPAHPGGAGAPPGTTTGPCQELADGGPQRLARGPDRAVDPEGAATFGPTAGQSGPWAKRSPAPE